jgi:hypothetical protein
MLQLELMNFRPAIEFVPFPIGVASNVFESSLYDELAANFPPIDMFEVVERKKDTQYKLNHKNRPVEYADYIRSTPIWREFDETMRSHEFGKLVLDVLEDAGIGFTKNFDLPPLSQALRSAAADILKRKRFPRYPEQLRTRFSFAIYPGCGGYIRPHTDATNTLTTLVVSMNRKDETWNSEWGGDLELCRPIDQLHRFNWKNSFIDFTEVEPIRNIPYLPNQAIFFVKTYDSWHCVRPMTAPPEANAWRKIILLVLETD